ncbi:MAG: hypothetical protein OXM87_11455, partial [Truepera sp.]|nr:hypothetical protein [Truepera sp.]
MRKWPKALPVILPTTAIVISVISAMSLEIPDWMWLTILLASVGFLGAYLAYFFFIQDHETEQVTAGQGSVQDETEQKRLFLISNIKAFLQHLPGDGPAPRRDTYFHLIKEGLEELDLLPEVSEPLGVWFPDYVEGLLEPLSLGVRQANQFAKRWPKSLNEKSSFPGSTDLLN